MADSEQDKAETEEVAKETPAAALEAATPKQELAKSAAEAKLDEAETEEVANETPAAAVEAATPKQELDKATAEPTNLPTATIQTRATAVEATQAKAETKEVAKETPTEAGPKQSANTQPPQQQ